MNNVKLFIIISAFLLVLSAVLGGLLYMSYTDSNNESNSPADTVNDKHIALSANGQDKIEFYEIKPKVQISCGTKITISAPENWYFEGQLPVQFLDSELEVKGSGKLVSSEDNGVGTITIPCDFPTIKDGYIKVAKDNPSGLPEKDDFVLLPATIVNFEVAEDVVIEDDAETVTFYVYFKDMTADPNVEYCEKVDAVKRTVPYTAGVGVAAINALIAGPTDAEVAAGYKSQLATGLKLNSLSISNGVAYADFSEELDKGIGGSCAVGMIQAQIEETLLQFSSVKSVVISRNGEAELILQP